ncbi:LOW QUALITY PROTEIN: katanin p80 WD40 repeat-containing subunit B1-like [Xenia sp. Carnegie-2017]|uniref:LOW QUALITY PROTEIN: katanin p80 WD40 repeat-containing subunit B1-like n=1 Tax=Xenia sp. Carnegie-2017 TaxID=2897299 RepID=UPI001F041DD3|nr:LOW QUALITY PROTEIN: katanin p80 WD40 repeat-containing subunit B1-like [Xenia sp. Carnegie-2017]
MTSVTTRAFGKKCWKQHEFVAHGHNVNCLALGRGTGTLMVTGGEDKKVNMWMVGKPNVILSLTGHTSPVECVQFNDGEDSVVAGSQSGTMKIWDVEAAKITRTLTGHKSSIKCTDFHPYGEYISSGSMDTNVKLWDIRRKGCIMTFKGHTDVVNQVRFSPDGRWIVSASNDSRCKLWDLASGKLLSEVSHAGPVNTVEFHPKEFLMATGSNDRTVKFWDLEKICLVSTTELESNPVRSVLFHCDGHCLFSGSIDSLKLYGWEPVRCFDSCTVGWGKISDMVFASGKLVAASFCQTIASIWEVDFQNIEEMIENFEQLSTKNHEPHEAKILNPPNQIKANEEKKVSPQRKVFDSKRPATSSSKARKSKLEQPVDKNQVRQQGVHHPLITEMFLRQNLFLSDHRFDQDIFRWQMTMKMIPSRPSRNLFNLLLLINQKIMIKWKVCRKLPRKSSEKPSEKSVIHKSQETEVTPVVKGNENEKEVYVKEKPDHIPSSSKPKTLIPSDRDKPAGLDMHEFLPGNDSPTQTNYQDSHFAPSIKISEEERLDSIRKGHISFTAVLTNRHRNVNMVWRLWNDGDIKGAVQIAINMNDQSTLVDFLGVLCLKQTLWTLDICSVVLPSVNELLLSRYETYVQTGASIIKLVLRNFSPVIKSNMAAPPVSVGVDVVREERFQKCQLCHAHLLALRSVIKTKVNVSGRNGSLFRELSLLLSSLD